MKGQEATFSYYKYDTKNGLPCNEIYNIFQDSRGYIWISTNHGLVKFDGYRFRTFTIQDGLTENIAFDVAEDKQGRLWVNTFLKGVSIGNENGFTGHPKNDETTEIAKKTGYYITSFDERGNWWMGVLRSQSSQHEVICLSDTSITKYELKRNESEGELFYMSADNVLFLKIKTYNKQLDKKLYENFKGVEKIAFTADEFSKIRQYEKGTVFGGNDSEYLYYASGKDFLTIAKNTKNIVAHYQYPGYVNKLEIIDDEVWVCILSQGVYRYRWEAGKLEQTGYFFQEHTVSDIFKDREDNYWFSTTDAGIFFVPSLKVTVVKPDISSLQSVFKVTWLGKLNDQLFAGTEKSQKVLVMDNADKLDVEKVNPGGAVTDIVLFNGKTYSNTEVYKNIFHEGRKLDPGIIATQIKIVKNYPGNNLLAAGREGVLICDSNFDIKWMSADIGFSQGVNSMLHVKDSTYYLGTEGGIYILNGKSIKPLQLDEPIKTKQIKDIKLSGINNELLLATRGTGLMIVKHGRVNYLTEKEGLASNFCEKILVENDSVYWVATFSGISKVMRHSGTNVPTYAIRNYTIKDGLKSNQVSAIELSDDKIWLGTDEGLMYFAPDEIEHQRIEVPVFFNSIRVNGNEISIDSALAFKHNENNITVGFAALHFRSQGVIRYKVRLKDDDEWIITDNNSIQYFGLKPGEYNISVMAEDIAGNYYSQVKSLSFVIHPKFTDTLLFRVSIVLLILLVVSAAVMYYLRTEKIKSGNRIMLLQSEYRALNYQINPHFIFNIFNSIQYFIVKKNTDKAITYLNSFSNLIRNVVKNAGQTRISVLEECESLREYLGLEQMRLDNRFTFAINIDSNVNVEQKLLLPMIIQPIVENSIWHGIPQGDSKCHISISFKLNGKRILCVVEDDGIGLKQQKSVNENPNGKSLSIALENLKERLRIVASLNRSTWNLTITDRSDIDPSLTGTRVVIEFPEI